jgi:hypothetical protein
MRLDETLLADRRMFRHVQVPERVLEGLFRTHGELIFPGYSYFDFKPAIPSRYGVRHPDGVLISTTSDEWWIVEIETHLHDVGGHIAPQLESLSEGVYGREALRYLDRVDGFDLSDYSINFWEPDFLLIVDHATPHIASAAAATAFMLLECAVYRTEAAEYALRLSGVRPAATPSVPRGIDVRIEDVNGVAMVMPLGGRAVGGAGRRTLTVGEVELGAYLTSDGRALALPATRTDIAGIVGESETYRLTSDDALIPLANKEV